MAGVELGDGVIADAENGEAYLMSPNGGIVAIGIDQGQEIWRSDAAAKPLLLAGDILLAQAEATEPGRGLKLLSLNARQQGKLDRESIVPLPSGVSSSVDQRHNQAFVARVHAQDEDAIVSWEYADRPKTGLPDGPNEILPGEESADIKIFDAPPSAFPGTFSLESGSVRRGIARLSLQDGSVTPIIEPNRQATPNAAPSAIFAPGTAYVMDDTVPNIPQPQYQSADRRHILHSSRVADDTQWERYEWRIFDRSTQQETGRFRYHASYEPFLVVNGRVLILSQPYQRVSGEQFVDEPLQLRALEVDSGTPVWHRPVRDIVQTEPPPP